MYLCIIWKWLHYFHLTYSPQNVSKSFWSSHLMNEDDCGIASEHDLATSTTSWARPWYAPQPFDCLKSYSKHSIHPHVLELILLHHTPLHQVRLESPLIGQARLLPNIEIQAIPSLVVELSISHHWLIMCIFKSKHYATDINILIKSCSSITTSNNTYHCTDPPT